jgi:hypothetical protein
MLLAFRTAVSLEGFKANFPHLEKLYGQDQGEERPHGVGGIWDAYAKGIAQKDQSKPDDTEPGKTLIAAITPGPEVSDRPLRHEAHLSREIDGVLNRLDRLQRSRRGQPLRPRIEVDLP